VKTDDGMGSVSRRDAARTMLGALMLPLAASLPLRAGAQDRPAIRIGTIPTEIAAAVYYARDLGYFAKAGYDVTITPIVNGAAVSSAVLSGALDVGFSNPVSLIIAHDRALPVDIIAGAGLHDAKTPTNGIMTVAAPSSIHSAKDLAGKTIAVSGLANITNLSARSWIDRNGGDSKASKYIEIPLPQMAADVLSGRVDAATMDAAGNEATENAQFRTLGSTFDAIAPRFLASLWFASSDWVTKHPADAKAFATIVRQASVWANANPRDAIAIYAKNSKYSVADLANARRPMFATTVTPELVQPAIDLSAKYGIIKAAFPAKDFITTFAS
jgi:NitT/TauT family transport system substrate-binding protein